jgi:DNA-binding NarL/FixJ family response regulator
VRSRPDVVLMDLRMPGVDRLTAIERLGKLADPPAIVVLTTFDADQYVLRALRAGAAGFLVKSTPPEDLIGLVQVAAGSSRTTRASSRRSRMSLPPQMSLNLFGHSGRGTAAVRATMVTT